MKYKIVHLLLALLMMTIIPASWASGPPIWFCPLDPLFRPEVGYYGSPQYMNLFNASSPWPVAARHVSVFKIYPQWIDAASDNDLRVQFADLNRRGIGLALEFGALTASTQCGLGVEGFGGEGLVGAVQRITADGGNLLYLAMDEPIYYSTLYKGQNACQWTPLQAAQNAAVNLKSLLTRFPNIKIGEIEFIDINTNIAQYKAGIEAFQSVLGAKLAFFDADVAWVQGTYPSSQATYPSALPSLESMVRSEGVPFGIIYNGQYNGIYTDQSDSAWIADAEYRMVNTELSLGPPDIAIIQSWDPYPKTLLPETNPNAMTHLINVYARTRTSIAARQKAKILSGTLLTTASQPVSAAPISISLVSAKQSALGTFTDSGVIPAGITSIVFAIRANEECNNCSGPASLEVREFSFVPSAGAAISESFTSASAANFCGGLVNSAGIQVAILQPPFLHVQAQAGQVVEVNCPVSSTAQGNYSFSVKAKVPPSSSGSGYFALIFLGNSHELSRDEIPFQASVMSLGTAVTNTNGAWNFTLPANDVSGFGLRFDYSGNATYWPARTTLAE